MNNCGIVEFNDFFSVNPRKSFAKDSDTRKRVGTNDVIFGQQSDANRYEYTMSIDVMNT